MDGSGLTTGDLALMKDNNNMFDGAGGMAFWIFALLFLNNGAFGGGRPMGPAPVTSAELQASQNAQTNALQLQGISQQLSDNRYDLAQALNMQTNTLEQQNNTNMINALQGFNNISAQITNQTNVLGQQLMALDAKLSSCCCEIKTQMLQDRLDEAERRNVILQNSLDNANQSQYILGNLGRFVAWAGSGSQAAATASAG